MIVITQPSLSQTDIRLSEPQGFIYQKALTESDLESVLGLSHIKVLKIEIGRNRWESKRTNVDLVEDWRWTRMKKSQITDS